MNKKKIILSFFVAAFFLADVLAFGNNSWAAEDAEDIQDKIDKYENKKEAVEKQLQNAQGNLQKTQAQIGTTQSLIQKTETEISRKEKELEEMEKRMELNKNLLKGYLQELYWNDQEPLTELLLKENDLNDISENVDQMMGIKEKILAILDEINSSKEESEKAKKDLSEKKEDHEKLLSVQKGQQYEIKTDISKAQSSLSELNAKINKLRGELSSLLGSSVSFKNIIDAAGFAAKVTGVRKDYLLGVLVVESNLGRYTGGCNFKESRMSGARAEIFKSICKELDYNYQKQKVSCPPSGYKGTGGAMGVAQFMPDTWKGYKSSIASVTGHNPPDPWSLTDGVVAMALKLSKVSGVTAHKESAEAKAYCVYLAGGNWASYCDSKGVNYGEKVLYWADNYEKLMD
ncbi:MAG TPA: lytic murein transglycosylase [Candidatus Moranbacteria bacterium]|nr:lytic murein transglycosylase [Candidatus Moranbacteria bacterium]